MEIFKTQKPCLILFLLIFHSSSFCHGEALSAAEITEGTTTQQPVPASLTQDGKNIPLLAPRTFPIPAINQNLPFGRSLNNPTQQPETVLPPQQQLNYPQQSLNQPLSGFTQPFSSISQPFLGVNQQPFSTFNQPFGVSNQQGLADNSNTLDNGVSEKNRFTIAIALVSLFALMVNLGYTA